MTQTTADAAPRGDERPGDAPREASEAEVAQGERIEAAAWADIFEAAPASLRERFGLAVEREGQATVFHARALSGWLFNRVIGLGVEEEVDLEGLAAHLEGFARDGVAHGVTVAPTRRASPLPAWLGEQGFTHASTLARMVRTTDAVPSPEARVTVRQVGRPEAGRFGGVMERAFGLPGMGEWFGRLCGRDGWRTYVAYDEGEAVGVGALFLHGRVGWLGCGGTLPERRGRGVQRAVMARRMADAADLGCSALQTETNLPEADEPAPSLRNMERLGFRMAYARPNHVRRAP